MFNRLFADFRDPGSAAPAIVDVSEQPRKSVLDFVAEDVRLLNDRLGAADRVRMDSHLTAVRDVEKHLTVFAQASATCTRPGMPPAINATGKDTALFPEIGKLQMDLLTMGLAC